MNRSFRDYVDVTLDVVLQVSWNILFPLLLLSFMRISLSFFLLLLFPFTEKPFLSLQRWKCRSVPKMKAIGDVSDLAGVNVVVTGCTSGIGKAAAIEFARRGCNLFLACRSQKRGETLKQELEEKYRKSRQDESSKIEVMHLDLTDLNTVVEFAKAFESKDIGLDILVNNAGVFAMSAPRHVCSNGYELHLMTNHLAGALLTLLLVPSLMRASHNGKGKAKVVMVNSKLHQMCRGFNFDDPNFGVGYNSKKAYAQSKLAQMLFTKHLRGKVGDRVELMVLHPGNVMTDVVRTLPWMVQKAYGIVMPIFLLTPEEGARSTLHAATCKDSEFYFDSNCKPTRPSREAMDSEQAEKVWEWTVKQIGSYLSEEVRGYF